MMDLKEQVWFMRFLIRNTFSKSCSHSWSREIFVTDFPVKSNPWTYKIKELTKEKILLSFHGK